MTLWAGRVGGTGLAPEVWDFLRAPDDELLPYDLQGTLVHAQRLHAAGLPDRRGAGRGRARGSARSRSRSVMPADEDVHSRDRAAARPARAEDPRRPLAQRPGRRRRPALRRDACAEADAALVRLARRDPRAAPSAEAATPMPGYTHLQRAQPVTLGHHLLALGRDARARPGPLRVRRRPGDALAARRGRARRLDAAAAAAARTRCATRSTRSPTATSSSTTSTPPPCSSRTSRGSARSSCSGPARSSASRGCPSSPRPARR